MELMPLLSAELWGHSWHSHWVVGGAPSCRRCAHGSVITCNMDNVELYLAYTASIHRLFDLSP